MRFFFLAPRVVDYPDANLSDTLLFLTQSPFVQEWRKLSLGDLTDYITDSIRETSWGQLAHSHSNKDVIDLFSVDEETGRLLFDGEPVISEGGDYNSLSHLPSINNVVIKGNKLASDFGLVGSDMFELDTTSVPGKTLIKAKYDGLYSMGDITGGGAPGSSAQSTGAMYLLADVAKAADGEHVGQTPGGIAAVAGQILGFDGTHWCAVNNQGGGGTSVSWGTESNNRVPLTVGQTTKTLLLPSALDGYLPKSGGQMAGRLDMYGHKITLCTYPNAEDCALFADSSENVFLDAYRSIYITSATGNVYIDGARVVTLADLAAYALLNGSVSQDFSAKTLTVPSTGRTGYIKIGNAYLWYDPAKNALMVTAANGSADQISILATGDINGGATVS